MLSFYFIGAFLAACADGSKNEHQQPPAWLSLHRCDKNLKGVLVNVSPEVPGAEKYFSEAMPYEVLYLFNDGRVHAVTTSFEGGVTEEWFASGEMDFDVSDAVPLEMWARKLGHNKP